MKLLKSFLAGVLAAVVVSTLLPTVAAGALATGTTASTSGTTCWRYRSSERAFADKMNLARRVHGVGRMYLDKQLSRVARKHTYAMDSQNRLYHTASYKLKRRVTRWIVLGENVGVGSTVTSLHKAFMNSPAHRANILYSRFQYVGVGVRNSNGRMWVTVVFESRRNPGTRLSMPPC